MVDEMIILVNLGSRRIVTKDSQKPSSTGSNHVASSRYSPTAESLLEGISVAIVPLHLFTSHWLQMRNSNESKTSKVTCLSYQG